MSGISINVLNDPVFHKFDDIIKYSSEDLTINVIVVRIYIYM